MTMLIFTHNLDAEATVKGIDFVLQLTAQERQRSRHRFDHPNGTALFLQLPRGSHLHNGDLIQTDDRQTTLKIEAKPEPLLTVTADTPLALLQAAYHLGNRHVPLEITTDYLRLEPDPVLKDMLCHRGLRVVEEIAPFHPIAGAYKHAH